MKPHEQDLVVSTYTVTDAYRRIPRHTAVAFATDLGLVASTGPANDANSEGYARLFAAAPNMARALLVLGHVGDGQWHLDSCWRDMADLGASCQCEKQRAALRKAGVL